MGKYANKNQLTWEKAAVKGGDTTVHMDKSIVLEGSHGIRSGFFRMPKGMNIPKHTHPKWLLIVVLEARMEVGTDEDGTIQIEPSGCYFVEPGDTHTETAIEDSLLLVTADVDLPEYPGGANSQLS